MKEDDEKGQICAACDCGTGQKACTPKENDKQICACDTGYAVKTDQTKGQICAACDCRTGQKTCTPKENDKQICTCDTGYAVKTDQTKGQICAACQCGAGEKTCKLTENDKQICTCDTGYAVKEDDEKGQICAESCGTNNCENGGTCIIEDENLKCICPAQYTGDKCEIDRCQPNPCKNNGNCKIEDNEVVCECKPPYSGSKCEKDPCLSQPCQNGGTCCINDNETKCKCTSLYGGKYCEIEIDQCVLKFAKGECSKEFEICNKGTCSCQENYAYSNNQECEPDFCGIKSNQNKCPPNAKCTPLENGFRCDCEEGYYQNGATCHKINLCSGVSNCQQLCDLETGKCNCVKGFELDSNKRTCNPTGDTSTCDEDCGAGTCVIKSGEKDCICPVVTHVYTNKSCEDYCTNKGQSPIGMCPQDKCEKYGNGFRCNCTGPYELDEDGIHCKRKAMCRDGGGNEICDNKNATCEELLSDKKKGYKCECKQGYERDGKGACISKCERKNCEGIKGVCEFYGEYEPICKCPLLMKKVDDKCSKLAENSYTGQLSVLKRTYEVHSVSGRSKRSIDDINYPKLRRDIETSIRYVYGQYKDVKLLECTGEGEILNCNLELQFENKMEKEELKKIADPDQCIPLDDTDYCWIKPNLILKKIENEG
ncbi:Tenascin-X, partial [Stegodyphus mimosarum]